MPDPIEKLLDSEGFISRECPNSACLRQFRVHNEGSPSQDTYVCPYCAHAAAGDSWWTQAQLRFQEKLATKVVEEKAAELIDKKFRELARRSGGTVKVKAGNRSRTPMPRAPAQADAGRLVTPPCHPTALLKVREDWQGAIHCFACGKTV